MDKAVETRFAHLLRPIRDLKDNWAIDVASELTLYLEELDDITMTFDGGRTTLNFAEAALVIQGSTCIYSKKVDHLYNLVFQTLDYISDRDKRNKEDAASGEDGAKKTRKTRKHMDDTELDSLDHVSTMVSQNTDMKESTARVEVAPLVPVSLLPTEPLEKQKLPLISLRGDVLGSCKDYRMNTFTPDPLGIIRLNQGSLLCSLLRDALTEGRPFIPMALFESNEGAGQAAGDAGMAVARDDGDEPDGGEDFLPLADFLPLEDQGMDQRVEVAPLVPVSLLPTEPLEKQKLPLISLRGDVLGSCKDYRMNTFTPDPLGIIRLNQGSLLCSLLRDADC